MARFLKSLLSAGTKLATGNVLGAGADIAGAVKKRARSQERKVAAGGGAGRGQSMGDELPTEWLEWATNNIIEPLLDGASDREIRAAWRRRPTGMKLTHVFAALRAGNADASQNILAANELEKILGRRAPRRAVPKWVTNTIRKVAAIKRVVRVGEGIHIRKKGGR